MHEDQFAKALLKGSTTGCPSCSEEIIWGKGDVINKYRLKFFKAEIVQNACLSPVIPGFSEPLPGTLDDENFCISVFARQFPSPGKFVAADS